MEFKEYSDKQLIRTLDNLLEEANNREITEKFSYESTANKSLNKIAETRIRLILLSKGLDQYGPDNITDMNTQGEEYHEAVEKVIYEMDKKFFFVCHYHSPLSRSLDISVSGIRL